MTLLHKIIEVIKQSDHEVVLPLIDILDAEINQNDAFYIKQLNRWLDGLQEMYDKAERFDEIENNLYRIDNLIDDAQNSLYEMRAYTDV